jgi:hypothetical protein
MSMPSRARAFACALAIGVIAAGCSSGSDSKAGAPPSVPSSGSPGSSPSQTPSPSPTPKPTPTIHPPQGAPGSWVTVVAHLGRPEIQTQTLAVNGSNVVVMRADTYTTRLVLHAGYQDPGGDQWLAGPAISEAEKPTLLAAFNGGFRLGLGLGGFLVLGRGAGAIQPGLASVVTYADGTSDIGAWGQTVPAAGKKLVSVRQNLGLLVDNGQPAADVDQYGPWGATLGGGFAVARSGLGIDQYGNLLWAGSTFATPRSIAMALIQSGAVRGMQLDINPMWVGAFAWPNAATQQPLMPGQYNGVGTYLQPYSRDYFTVGLRLPASAEATPTPSP